MAAVVRKSACSFSPFVALVVFAIVMKSATFSGVVAATESMMCEASSLPPEVLDLIGEVNVTLKTLKTLLLAPPSGEERGRQFDTCNSEGSVAQSDILLLLLRMMETQNKQLRMSLGLREESQKSESPCHTTQCPRDCHDLFQQGKNESGIYTIYPQMRGFVSEGGVRVWCDLEGEESGWTVVLLRRPLEEQVDFNHGWRGYRLGFGDPQTEYWIGNDVLHIMTSGRRQILRVDMMDWDGNTAYAEYNTFRVESSDNEFRLHVGEYSGNAGDSLSAQNDLLFSTPDRDNDQHSSEHCAHDKRAGFWYKGCSSSGPTHPLTTKKSSNMGMYWYPWGNSHYSLQTMSFKLKPAICFRG